MILVKLLFAKETNDVMVVEVVVEDVIVTVIEVVVETMVVDPRRRTHVQIII